MQILRKLINLSKKLFLKIFIFSTLFVLDWRLTKKISLELDYCFLSVWIFPHSEAKIMLDAWRNSGAKKAETDKSKLGVRLADERLAKR